MDNLFSAWEKFKQGKRKKPDVRKFEHNLKDNIFKLRAELKSKTYQHSDYVSFLIKDPKLREIHKACVKDRVLQQAVFRVLYPIFDKTFIFDSYSCRLGKGTHRAVNRLKTFARKVGKNNAKTCWFLKCDIRKFFDSIDQNILILLIKNRIKDKDAIWLVEEIIKSFSKNFGKGLPLGNVTSQLFSNIYLNELDQFIKQELKIKYYIRYCDDFLILNVSREYLENLILAIGKFLSGKLNLTLHPDKIILMKYSQGIDFLGYVSFPSHTTLRIKTKNRILKKIEEKLFLWKDGSLKAESFNQSLKSYWGVLKHCDSFKIKNEIIKIIRNN